MVSVRWPRPAAVSTSRVDSDMTTETDEGVSQREFRTVMAGLLLVLGLASLDQNIVATALPGIVSELGGLAHLSWVLSLIHI